jgi:hypothetical protein
VAQWLDWPAFGFLALLTLLDGLRRVPAGALVLRRLLWGKWDVVNLRPGYRLVSLWPPLSTTIVLGPSGEPSTPGELPQRLERYRNYIVLVSILGGLNLLALVVVLPVAMRWWGALGFLASLVVVLVLSILTTIGSFYTVGALGLRFKSRLVFALPRLNPFAAPAAGEAILEKMLAGMSPVAAAKHLMNESAFRRWIRPVAYDVLADVDVERRKEVLSALNRQELQEITSQPSPGEYPFCPRCGAEFRGETTHCPECEVGLSPPAQAPSR